MVWNILWAVIGGLAQLGTAFMGWKVTHSRILARRRRLYEGLFLFFGLLGVTAVGMVAYRSGRQERAHFSVYEKTMFIDGSIAQSNQRIGINVYFENVGSGTAVKTAAVGETTLQEDDSLASQQAAIEQFEKWKAYQNPSPSDLAKTHKSYITAYGPIMSPGDVENITLARRIPFTVADIPFMDDFGSHTQHVCVYPEPMSHPAIWVHCRSHNEEH